MQKTNTIIEQVMPMKSEPKQMDENHGYQCPHVTGCYFETNNYGFKQKRIYGESTLVERSDITRGIELKNILNPGNQERYGGVTKYLAIDCEMDQQKSEFSSTGLGGNIPCKVSLVNQQGIIVFDTLIQPCVDGINYPNPKQNLLGYKTLVNIHGIKSEWLEDAPTFESVRHHILELCGKLENIPDEDENQKEEIIQDGSPPRVVESATKSDLQEIPIHKENFDPKTHSIFIGHGVTYDLKVMGIYDVPYICTQNIDKDPVNHQSKKLKDLSQKHLNIKIQEGCHSSIIDSRASLGLFLKLESSLGLTIEGPQFLQAWNLFQPHSSRRRRNKQVSFSQMVHRKAFKCLENIDQEKQYEPIPAMPSSNVDLCQAPQKQIPLDPVSEQLKNMILSEGKIIDPKRIYRINRKELNRQIDAMVKKQFQKIFQVIAFSD